MADRKVMSKNASCRQGIKYSKAWPSPLNQNGIFKIIPIENLQKLDL